MTSTQFHRENLPEPFHYYTDIAGLEFQERKGIWRTTDCLHCGHSRLRINTETGGFVCMSGCGAKGGDVLAYHRAAHGMGFVEAATALGAYIEDGKPYTGPTRPAAVPARDLLQCVSQDLMQCAMVLSDALSGKLIYETDFETYRAAASRVIYIAGVAA
jgi:hypothetical protein